MGAVFDFTAASAVAKQRYTTKKLNTIEYTDNPFHAMVPKDEKLGGLNHVWGVRGQVPTTRSATFGLGQSGGGGSSSTYKRFTAPHFNDFAFAYISGDAIDSTKGDENALVEVLTGEIDGSLLAATRSLAIAEYKNGGGARGRILSTSNIGTTTITLDNVFDVTNFESNMVLQAATTDGTSGAVLAGTVTLAGRDSDAGTLTASANWNVGIPGITTTSFLFSLGDFGAMMPGLLGYLPTTAPAVGGGDSFFTVDRSSEPSRYAGVRTTGGGAPYEETVMVALARLKREGSKTSHIAMNIEDWANFEKAISGKVIYDRATAFNDPNVGFTTIKGKGPAGPVDIFADVNCPKGTGFGLMMSTWTLMSIGRAPRIIDLDSLSMIRQATADTYEVRLVSRVTLRGDAPGWNSNIQW